MKKFFLSCLFSILSIGSLTGCMYTIRNSSQGYRIQNGEVVYYRTNPETNDIITTSLNADAATFKEISTIYGLDKDKVYCYGKSLESADPKSFIEEKIKYFSLGLDKEHVYLNCELIPEADPQTFSQLDSENMDSFNPPYFIDKNHVYSGSKIIEGADPQTFTLYSPSKYATDKNHVYIEGKVVNDLNPKSFKILFRSANHEIDYIADNKKLIFIQPERIKVIDNIDPSAFEILHEGYGVGGGYYVYFKDKNHVYLNNEIIMDAQPETFTYIDHGYSKDSLKVFFYSHPMQETDINSFEVLDPIFGNVIAKDKKYLYNGDQKLPNIDPATLTIDFRFLKDVNSVFYFTDPYSCCSELKKVEGADPVTFQVLSPGFFKDKSFVYFSVPSDGDIVHQLDDSDVQSFHIVTDNIAKDKNFQYIIGQNWEIVKKPVQIRIE